MLGIVFSGGGVKGIAHGGVLKALEEEGITPNVFVGTSSGSHVAFLASIGYSSFKIKKIYDENAYSFIGQNDFKAYLFSKKFKLDGLRSGKPIEDLYESIGRKEKIVKVSDVKNPLGIVATDLIKEKEVWFSSKKVNTNKINITDVKIGKAIRASSSFSVMYDPCEIDENIYLDGGVFNNTPTDLAIALGATKVLAIIFEDFSKIEGSFNVINIGIKTIDMMSRAVSEVNINRADIVVKIKSSSNNLLDISNSDKYFEEGYIAMKNKMSDLKNILEI